jgi:GxxExxY protein
MDDMLALKHSKITGAILKAFFDIFNDLSGFPEFVLRRALATVLRDQHLTVEEEAWLPVWYRGRRIARFRADLIVNGCVIVEVKTRYEIDPLNKTQLLHYLKATGLEVGLLLNFGKRPEFSRVVLSDPRRSEDPRDPRPEPGDPRPGLPGEPDHANPRP